eukprot:CAMPEP_0182495446 /NCGR_PEP_ID=MMETSP1321-20130603/4230_1 /TAXON_ID=91990 /ORGANISM="Bolidomonas sp., Strain RCC1657" /LENGTH=128 /DNA_ID=CAMNT_0024698831 /DNA_START=16 /DNA_END=398 /DNA_ORIENTATION=-
MTSSSSNRASHREGAHRESTLYTSGYFSTFHSSSESSSHLQSGFDSGYSSSFTSAFKTGETLGTLSAAEYSTKDDSTKDDSTKSSPSNLPTIIKIIKEGLKNTTDLANKRSPTPDLPSPSDPPSDPPS